MTITTLTSEQASVLSVRALGLDSESLALDSTEALTAGLLRAASFMCPANPSAVVLTVLNAVSPLAPVNSVNRERLGELLDTPVADGQEVQILPAVAGG